MPRGAHIDHQATASARLSRVLRDRRSFMATDGRVFLEGKDVRRARARVFGRDEGLCIDCGKEVSFDQGVMPFGSDMEMSHVKPRSLGGDDSDANLATLCRPCHRKRDLHDCPGHF
jgi:5-methylcytosine-specific restriction endonuclease McrA